MQIFQRKFLFFKIFIAAIFLLIPAAIFLFRANDFKLKTGAENFGTLLNDDFTRHAETLRRASAENIKGDFTNQNSFEFGGVKTSMTRENENFFAGFARNEKTEKYKIAAVVGAKQIEEYIAEIDGEFRRLPVAYDLRKKRWINLNEAYFEPDGEDFFRHQKNFQNECAACHLPARENQLRTTNDELRIQQVSENISNAAPSDLSKLSELNSDAVLLACGKCHAKDLNDSIPDFDAISANQKSASTIVSAHKEAAPDASHFFESGEIRAASHEYQGVLRSVCYIKSKAGGDALSGEKINCLSCHSTSDGSFDVVKDAKLHTNQICTSCHQQFEKAENLTAHTKHSLDSAVNCQSCHMPEIVYGNLKFQKTHQISVPNPELTITKSVPNACNACHLDKSVNWAISQSKRLWTENFRDAKTSTDAQFNEPEGIRGLIAGDAFTRAWTADSLEKNADSAWAKLLMIKTLETENYPLVAYFLTQPVKQPETNSPFFIFGNVQSLQNSPRLSNRQKTNHIFRRLRKKRSPADINVEE